MGMAEKERDETVLPAAGQAAGEQVAGEQASVEEPPAGETATMGEKEKEERAAGGSGEARDAGGEGSGAESVQEEAAQVTVEELQAQLAAAEARAQEYYERLVRLQADFENYRKRIAREKEEWLKYASEPVVVALLPVLDNFERALQAKESDPAKVVAGIEMIYKQLWDVLSREGLQPVPAVGEQFDPNRHEAIMQEISSEYPDNTVIEELQRGYFFKDKVVRPALVKVARAE